MRPSKTELRREIRARFRAESELADEKSAAICRWIASEPAWAAASTVAIFAPTAGEPLVEGLWEMAGGRTLCYPRIRGRELDFCSVSGPWTLEKSVYGLREPSAEAVRIKPGGLDLVIVPGMAFTRCGGRLGRGGGFYDRFLGGEGGRGAVRLGVCFEWQLLDWIPEEPHDSRMDLVVSEAGVYSGGTSSKEGIRVNTGSPSSQTPK